MRCDRGKGSKGTRYTENPAITIHESRRCRRNATRWINGENIGFEKVCGICARSSIDWYRWEYGLFDTRLGSSGMLCPKYEDEYIFKEYQTRKEVELNRDNHMIVISKITKKERREYEES